MRGIRQQTASRYFRVLFCAHCLGMALAAVSFAQTPLPPAISGDDQSRKMKIILDSDSRLVADEYVDLLRQLQDVVKDYSSYLQDSQSDLIKRYRQSLARMGEHLSQGSYDDNTERLSTDLEDQLSELAELETNVRESSEVFPMRTYRLIKSLRREIAGINDLVNNDLSDRLRENQEMSEEIAAYVRAVLANINVQVQNAPDGKTVVIVQSRPGATPRALSPGPSSSSAHAKAKSRAGSLGVAIAPVELPNDSDFHLEMTIPPTPPLPSVPQADWFGKRSIDEAGVEKEFDDSMTVTSPKATIRVENRMGQVTITGTSSSTVVAHLAVSYEADSRQREKEFGNSIQLKLTRHGDDYLVSTVLPKLDGSEVRVGNSELTIEVPSHNPLVVINNLGGVSVNDLQADLDVTGAYSQIDIADITGAVTVTSATGELSVSSVKGELKLKNSYAPISVSECRGDMKIQNSYGPVSITNSRGTADVQNSGAIDISDHTGNVTVVNSFGPVEINNLRGNVNATNRFQPITVSDITGLVVINGVNSQIGLSNISGSVTATNQFGQITAEGVGGPLKVSNQNGSVTVVLGDEFRGNSSISTTFGNINLSVPEGVNLLLNARTQFGSITSFKPIHLLENGMTRTGTLRLGTGKDSLSLVTANASISINSK
jgi:hypothetical protein